MCMCMILGFVPFSTFVWVWTVYPDFHFFPLGYFWPNSLSDFKFEICESRFLIRNTVTLKSRLLFRRIILLASCNANRFCRNLTFWTEGDATSAKGAICQLRVLLLGRLQNWRLEATAVTLKILVEISSRHTHARTGFLVCCPPALHFGKLLFFSPRLLMWKLVLISRCKMLI